MPPTRLSDEERAAWAKAHRTQTDAALANLDAADRALDDDDDGPVCEVVHLHQTLCSFVLFHRDVSHAGGHAGAYDIWRCASAREAEALAAARSHAGFPMRNDTMLGISRAAAAQQAALIAANARKRGKVGPPAAVESDEGPFDDAGAAGFPAARSREERAGGDGGAGVDDDAFASPERKKQKKAAAKGAAATPAAATLLTPAPVEAPVPTVAPHLAQPRMYAALPSDPMHHAAPPPRYADAERVEALETQLKQAQRSLKRMTRRCEELAQAQEAQRAAFEALRASLGTALTAAAAACVSAPAPGAA